MDRVLKIKDLMAAPASPETGRLIWSWATQMRDHIARGDLAIGLMSPDDVRIVPAALRRASECGMPDALTFLAEWLINPPIGEPQPDEAIALLREAVTQRAPGAALQLAKLHWFHRRAEATEAQKKETHTLLSDLVRANPKDKDALYVLGLTTAQGFGTKADPTAAVTLQNRAADLGNQDAMFELFLHYALAMGVELDEPRAISYLRRAAEAGHARSAYNMGAFHATGRYVEKDVAESVRWYQAAVNAGHTQATLTLAVMYATGDGAPKDIERARELFEIAENQGADIAPWMDEAGLT